MNRRLRSVRKHRRREYVVKEVRHNDGYTGAVAVLKLFDKMIQFPQLQ